MVLIDLLCEAESKLQAAIKAECNGKHDLAVEIILEVKHLINENYPDQR